MARKEEEIVFMRDPWDQCMWTCPICGAVVLWHGPGFVDAREVHRDWHKSMSAKREGR